MNAGHPGAKMLGVLGSLLALGLPVYTGFDLTVHQNRPVWNTPLMPVLFVAMSLVSGAAVAALLARGEERVLCRLRPIMLWSAGAVAVMLISLLGTTSYGGVGAQLTFMYLTSGQLGIVFLGVGILAGLMLPIILLLESLEQARRRNHGGGSAARGGNGASLFDPNRRPDRPDLLLTGRPHHEEVGFIAARLP